MKTLRINEAEVVCDRIAELRPALRDIFAEEVQRRFGELSIRGVTFVVCQMLVHDAHNRSIGFECGQ